MTDESSTPKVSGKIEFGFDYLHVMRTLILQDGSTKERRNDFSDAIARFFLLLWGFSVGEIDEANKVWYDRLEKKQLPDDVKVVFSRIVDFIKNEPGGTEKFVSELVTITALDDNLTDDERSFLDLFSDLFDLKPSEFKVLVDRGVDWSLGLKFICDVYHKSKTS